MKFPEIVNMMFNKEHFKVWSTSFCDKTGSGDSGNGELVVELHKGVN